jgi:hypothetical protein
MLTGIVYKPKEKRGVNPNLFTILNKENSVDKIAVGRQ